MRKTIFDYCSACQCWNTFFNWASESEQTFDTDTVALIFSLKYLSHFNWVENLVNFFKVSLSRTLPVLGCYTHLSTFRLPIIFPIIKTLCETLKNNRIWISLCQSHEFKSDRAIRIIDVRLNICPSKRIKIRLRLWGPVRRDRAIAATLLGAHPFVSHRYECIIDICYVTGEHISDSGCLRNISVTEWRETQMWCQKHLTPQHRGKCNIHNEEWD